MIILIIYMLMTIAIPIIFCILVYRLRRRLPIARFIVPAIIVITLIRTFRLLPMYMIVPAILESSYDLFLCFLLIFGQAYNYGITIMILYIVSYIYTKENVKFIVSRIIIGVLVFALIFFVGNFLFKERTNYDNLYMQMKEYDDSDSLIGLSKEEVIILLEEPVSIHEYENSAEETYIYDAGNMHTGIIWGNRNVFTTKYSYIIRIEFDETGKVESTSMREVE